MSNLVQLLQQMKSNQPPPQQQTGQAVVNTQSPPIPQQTDQASWVQNLIAQHANDGGRIKRTPVGFNFQSIPFDPSSYYRALDTSKAIQQAATAVTQTEAANRAEKARQVAEAAANAAAQQALAGVNPNFTGGGGNAQYNGSWAKTRHYNLSHLTPNTAKAADYFGSKYGIGTEYGWAPTNPVPGSDHPFGRAIDYMVYNNRAKGTALANDVIKNAKQWNVKYVIWYHYIWNPRQGWHRYSGSNPHTDHVHVSFYT